MSAKPSVHVSDDGRSVGEGAVREVSTSRLTWCQASCGRCQTRTYDPNVECADRHFQCQQWTQLGECKKNPLWMAENCRRSCDRCSTSKAQICTGGGRGRSQLFRKLPTNTTTTTTTTPAPKRTMGGGNESGKCDSTGCYNENVCCAFWGLQGQCARNTSWMSCNCRVSCGYCIPADYFYGSRLSQLFEQRTPNGHRNELSLRRLPPRLCPMGGERRVWEQSVDDGELSPVVRVMLHQLRTSCNVQEWK
jgi:hypothetical protein